MLSIYRNLTEIFKAKIYKYQFIHSQRYLGKLQESAQWGLFWSCHRLTQASWIMICTKDTLGAVISPKVFICFHHSFKLNFDVNLRWKHGFDKKLIRSLYLLKPVQISPRYFFKILVSAVCYQNQHRNFSTVPGEYSVLLWESGLLYSLPSSIYPFYCCILMYSK